MTWTYTILEPGSYPRRRPHSYQFLRDHHATLDVTARRPPPTTGSPHTDPADDR